MAITDIVVSGKLFEDDGDPVNGAVAALLETGTSTQETSTTTDSNGAWSFTETSLDATYDVKFTQGSSVRYILWSDEIALKGVDTASLKVRGVEGAAAPIYLFADQADDNIDVWRINAADGGVLTFDNRASGSSDSDLVAQLTITPHATITSSVVAVAGDLTVGDDFSLTSDSAVFNMGAGNDFTITHDGTTGATIAGNPLTLDSGADIVLDAEGADVILKDGGTQYGSLTNSSSNLLIKSGSTTAATFSGANVTFAGTVDATTDFTIGDTVITDGVITDSTGLQLAANLDIDGTADISGDLTLSGGADGALQFTNAGENSIKIPDDQASALIIEEADNAYITFVTTNSSEAITVAKATTFSAGIANAGTISAGTWNGTAIASGYIAGDAITGAKIADDAIDSEHYTDGSIDNAHLADDAVGADELAANAVVDASVASGAAIAVSKLALTAGDGLTLNTNDMDLDASLTTVTSILNASLVVGRDADNDIDFSTDNNIRFRANGEDQLTLTDGALTPSSNAIVDLGTDSLEFKDAYFDGTLEADAITIGGTNVVTGSLITTLGTISAGVWEGTDVAVAHGGTGASSLTDGGVLLGSGTSAVTAMAVLADGEMIVGDGTTDPVAESGAALRTSIGVGTGDSPQFTGLVVSEATESTSDAPTIRITNSTSSGSWGSDVLNGALEFYSADDTGNGPYVTAAIKSISDDTGVGVPAGSLGFFTRQANAADVDFTEKMRLSRLGYLDMLNNGIENVGNASNKWNSTSLINVSGIYAYGTGNAQVQSRVVNTQNVANSATKIAELTVDTSTGGAMVYVMGAMSGDSGESWMDVVILGSNAHTVLHTFTARGSSSDARTYTHNASGDLFVEMADTTTYDITTYMLEFGSPR